MPSELLNAVRSQPNGGGAKSKSTSSATVPSASNSTLTIAAHLTPEQSLVGGVLTLGRNLQINSIRESLQIFGGLEADYLEQLNSSDAKQRLETAKQRLTEMCNRHEKHRQQMTAADAEYRKAVASGDASRIDLAEKAFKDAKGREELDRIERETITELHDKARSDLYNSQDQALFNAWRTARLSLVKQADELKRWARELFADEEFQQKIRDFSAVILALDFVGTSFSGFQDNVRRARNHGVQHPNGGPMPIGKVIDDALKGEPANLPNKPIEPKVKQFTIDLDGEIELVSASSPEEAWAKFVEESKVPASRRQEAKIKSADEALDL